MFHQVPTPNSLKIIFIYNFLIHSHESFSYEICMQDIILSLIIVIITKKTKIKIIFRKKKKQPTSKKLNAASN